MSAPVRVITITTEELAQIVRSVVREELAARGGRQASAPRREWLTVQEAAESARCSEETILGWIHAGKLPRKMVGRRYRVDPADLARALEVQGTGAEPIDLRSKAAEIIRRARG